MRVAALLFLALTLGCMPADLVVPSPDGRHTASVRNLFTIDPPAQSLWLDDTHIVDLAEDVEWCREIVWSDDGSTVAFLVRDAKLIAVDAATARITSTQWLVERDGYPPTATVYGLQLSGDGGTATFKRCPRGRGACSEPLLASLR